MSDNFANAFQVVVGVEAGYVNDPNDPGGETKYGISHRSYPNLDIKSLTLEQAKDIYLKDFWLNLDLDKKPYSLGLILFDCAVNQGPSIARSLYNEQDPLNLLVKRALLYIAKSNFKIFGSGWLRRLFYIASSIRAQ